MTVYVHHKADGTVDHLQCDDHRHDRFHSFDSEPDFGGARDDRERDDDDEKLARCVADAVCDAIKAFRKGDSGRSARDEELERREKSLDEREEAYRRSAGDRARDGKSRAADSKRGMVAQDASKRALADANSIWPVSRPYRNDASAGSADVDAIFGSGSRH